VIEAEDLCARASRLGQRMRAHLEALQREIPQIGERARSRCDGGVRAGHGPKTKEPDAALTAAILASAEKRGLVLLSCGTEANVVRLLAPLTIPDAIVEEAWAAVRFGKGSRRVRIEARGRLSPVIGVACRARRLPDHRRSVPITGAALR